MRRPASRQFPASRACPASCPNPAPLRLLTAAVSVAVLSVAVLGGCSDAPTVQDLPPGVASARPDITAEEARFVLAANKAGADISGSSVAADIESGKAVCWALENGGVQLKDMAADLTPEEAPRAKALMAAAVPAFCPDFEGQLGQLGLPG